MILGEIAAARGDQEHDYEQELGALFAVTTALRMERSAHLHECRKTLRNEENLAGVRILHLAAGAETIHVHITAIRIVWTKHVARFSRNSLGCGKLRGAIGSAFRRLIWRWLRLLRNRIPCNPWRSARTWLSRGGDLPRLRFGWSDLHRSAWCHRIGNAGSRSRRCCRTR